MKQYQLSEAQVLDAFNFGEQSKSSLPQIAQYQALRKYSGYEIGVLYSQDNTTGQYFIVSCWSRPRR